jgi:hypothetical protein
MKKVSMAAAALALVSAFSTAAMAKDVNLAACTKDGNTAIMTINMSGSVKGGKLDTIVKQAFGQMAHSLTTEEMLTEAADDPGIPAGWNTFMDNIESGVGSKKVSKDYGVGGSVNLTVIEGCNPFIILK